jgi:UMF1 family MFS transporter
MYCVTMTAPSTAPASPVSAAVPRRRIVAWALWDWGGASFNAVVTTFVFTVYLTGNATRHPFGDEAFVSAQLGWTLGIAGVVVALLAPVTGQRSDTSGNRKLWLGVNTYIVVAIIAGLFFVQAAPEYLWLGLLLLAAGSVFFQFAEVNYNAMLSSVSTPRTIGKVSGSAGRWATSAGSCCC